MSNSVSTKDSSIRSNELIPPNAKNKFRGELWTNKLKHKDESWTTCNKEYGEFVSKRHVLRVDGKDNEKPEDGGPVLASSYQMGYNLVPDLRQKWLDSWRGYVKPNYSDDEVKDMIAPNSYREKAPPMKLGEGWIDNGPWGSSTYQMGYNVPPGERDPKPIYRFAKEDPGPGITELKPIATRNLLSDSNPFRSLRTLPKHVQLKKESPRNIQGVKLPPIAGISTTSRKDIVLHDGSIYMRMPSVKNVDRVNEEFFNFRYRDFWRPLPMYKQPSTK